MADLLFTRFDARRPSTLTKRFELLPDGRIQKSSSAQLTDGTAKTARVPSLAAFADYLEALPPAAALAYGVATGHPDARVVSEARAAEHPDAITRTRRFFGFPRAPGLLMLDHDPVNGETAAPGELIELLRGLAPCLESAPCLWRASASSGITQTHEPGALTGQRLYIPVLDAALIPAAGKALTALLWAAGHGRIAIGKAGQALERTAVDSTVWQPERLDFAAAPVVVPPLTRVVPPPFVEGLDDARAWCDLRELIAAADGDVHKRAMDARRAAHSAAQPDLSAARTAWIDATAPAIAAAHGIDEDAVKLALLRASTRFELTGDFVLTAADGTHPRVGDLLDHPAKWHGQRFADPLEPDYGADARIAWANLRGGSRPHIYSHAHGGRRFYLIRPSARIALGRGQRARIVDQTLDLLRTRGDLYDFGPGAVLARVTDDARVTPITRDWLHDHLDRVIEYFTLVPSTKPEDPPTEEVADAPQWAAVRILAKDGDRDLARLDAVVTAPTLRPDGSILAEAGYDAPARVLLMADTPTLPHIPKAPTPAAAAAALATLWRPVHRFPLLGSVDRAVVLAAMLTAAVRPTLPTAPGFGFDAPAAGTGKTLLAQTIAAILEGHAPAVMPPAANQDEEIRKRLFAGLRQGHRVMLWDNMREPLGAAALDAFLTAPDFLDRILGTSTDARLPNRALFIVTGNNLRLVGDTWRRVLVARIDACSEKPYMREFDFCPLSMAITQRYELVAAALTLIRAWITAGRPLHGPGNMASFESWDRMVRQTVCWVATWDARFDDPCKATERALDLDPETAKLAAMLNAWNAVIGVGEPITTARLIDRATPTGYGPDADTADAIAQLHDAIEEIAGDRGMVNRRILGRWIERNVDRRHDGLHLTRGTLRHGSPTWILRRDAETPAVGTSPAIAPSGSGWGEI